MVNAAINVKNYDGPYSHTANQKRKQTTNGQIRNIAQFKQKRTRRTYPIILGKERGGGNQRINTIETRHDKVQATKQPNEHENELTYDANNIAKNRSREPPGIRNNISPAQKQDTGLAGNIQRPQNTAIGRY